MKALKNVELIITHPGGAHRDEFLAICLALCHIAVGGVRIERRDPTTEELEDDSVLVLDVGGKHNQRLLNFDHHQMGREEAPASAFSLFIEYLGLAQVFAYQKWYDITNIMDSKGPFAVSRHCELPRFPFELMSPIESALLERFSKMNIISSQHELLMMQAIGEQVLSSVRQYAECVAALASSATHLDIAGVPAIVVESSDTTGLQDHRDGMSTPAGISICHDDRGPGWTLYRFNDDSRVDFSGLDGLEEIEFAHKGGFIAKTKERLPLESIIALAEKAVR